jgi:sugar phosphate permease
MGFMVSGAANLISSTVSADLASDPAAKATVIGIINGTGSMGAALGQILIGWLQGFSWNAVFGFLVGKD